MAFKIVVLFATLACASAGYVEPGHHHLSYEAAPVAHYSSAPAVSYSSITREDKPKLAVAKHIAYAEPAVHYAAPITKSYAVHEPALKTVVAQPAYAKAYVSEPQIYAHAAPVVAAKTLAYAAPQVHHYQPEPLIKNVEYTKTLAYAPVAKTYVSQPATYAKHIVAEPAYTKHIVAEPAYTKHIVAEPAYTKHIVAQPEYTKHIVAQPAYTKTVVAEPQVYHSSPVYAHSAPVVAAKTLSYAPAEHVSHVSYADNSAHYAW